MTETAAAGGRSGFDDEVDEFLPGYVREHIMFSDDQLDFDVDSVVTIRGSVENEAERQALVQRIRRVSGVREVRAEGLSLAGF